MQACAFVTSNADIPALVKSQFERVYSAANLSCYFSDSENDALDWLASLGCFLEVD
ncbi:dihydrolipoamide dehydrogenase [Alteromonas sp. BL110]|nr:dihydrolipoamide dehydrogenase [Alteromonas sp. BL110]RKM82014.1 dihydrolipoamide dehydrogenase [Alteromonas sp. BL110]